MTIKTPPSTSEPVSSPSSSGGTNYPTKSAKTVVDPVTKGSYQAPQLNGSNLPELEPMRTDFQEPVQVVPVRVEPAPIAVPVRR